MCQLMAVSQVKVLLQMTFGVLVFCVLVGTSSSYELREYRAMKLDNGEVMCITSPPNKTLNGVHLRVNCAAECSRGCQSPCQAINYRQTAELCELFHYEPCSYDLQHDCYNFVYQVVDIIAGLSGDLLNILC